jgi:hypothetical protein
MPPQVSEQFNPPLPLLADNSPFADPPVFVVF